MDSKGPKIFDYYDYARYLRNYYEYYRIRNSWFSYRYIQEKTGVDPSYLAKVFQGKKHLAQSSIPKFVKLLKLNKREKEYFNLMFLFGKAKSNDEMKLYFEQMLAYIELGARKVESGSYEYYTKWYYAAIRQIISYYPFSEDYTALAKMTVPEITPKEAKKAISLLTKFGFIHKKDGIYKQTSRFLTTGEEWKSIAIRQFQEDTIGLAQAALANVPKEERNISTITLTLSEGSKGEVEDLIDKFRHGLMEIANKEEKANSAYHVNIQLIPIGKPWNG